MYRFRRYIDEFVECIVRVVGGNCGVKAAAWARDLNRAALQPITYFAGCARPSEWCTVSYITNYVHKADY